jgi:hypothetical protein
MGLSTPLEAWNEAQYKIHNEILDNEIEYQSVSFDNAGSN